MYLRIVNKYYDKKITRKELIENYDKLPLNSPEGIKKNKTFKIHSYFLDSDSEKQFNQQFG